MKKNLNLKNNIFLYENPFFSKSFEKQLPNLKFHSFDRIKKIKKDKVVIFLTKLNHKLDQDFLKEFSNLRYLISPTTGTNHIDLNYCKKNKIKIINLKRNDFKNKDITSTIEHTLTLILASLRDLYSSIQNVKKGNWNRYDYNFFQFKKYTVGIIGNGRIGSNVVKILKYLKFKVLVHDKKNTKSNLNKLLKKSDIISIHVNSYKNENFFSKKEMLLCKKNVIIINTSRGEIINEKDLMFFLKKNKKASAFVDVISNEQVQSKNKKEGILKFNRIQNNLFITPHIAGAAIDAQKLTEEIVLFKYMKYENQKLS